VLTAPATVLLILVPYLSGASLFKVETLIVGFFALLAHWISFGHNSLMDTAMGYDLRDPSKSHHPLITGKISLTAAHNVIHWSLCGLSIVAIIISLSVSPNPLSAVICVFLWFVFGYAYNSGLSKETVLSFVPISICFTVMGAWGWFLSHARLNYLASLLLAYFFMTILWQISWSGHLKELELGERSNILVMMGARVEGGKFKPGWAGIYGISIKMVNLTVGLFLATRNPDPSKFVWFIGMTFLAAFYLKKLVMPRKYERDKELFNMSIMEIITIYLPIPLVLGWLEASILMATGVLYFFGMNEFLWEASYPRV
jgi:4-hydroxybenzoate polyprenyltransferase